MVGDGAIARASRSSPMFPRAVNQKERLLVAVGKPLSLEPVRVMTRTGVSEGSSELRQQCGELVVAPLAELDEVGELYARCRESWIT